jgi:hypothetical protein
MSVQIWFMHRQQRGILDKACELHLGHSHIDSIICSSSFHTHEEGLSRRYLW